MKRTLRIIIAVACILTIAVCASLILRKFVGRARLDLTERKLYTLSDGTRNILLKLNQPVRLKLYYSKTAAMKGPEMIREYNNYYLYVRDLLREYEGLSRGNLTLETTDPRRYTDAEDDAIREGVKKLPFGEDEYFFFGLVAKTELGKQEVIPFFAPGRQEFVEYDVSKLIASVVRREKKKVGVLSSLEVAGSDLSPYMMQMMQMQGRQPPQAWQIVDDLRDEYEVVGLKPDSETIDKEIDFLVVIHPKKFSDKTLFAIDQFVMLGGKLIVFVDPHSVADPPEQDPRNPMAAYQHRATSDLNRLLSGWGVEMVPGVIAADRSLAIKVRGFDGRAVAMPIYLNLNETCVSQDEVITATLHSITAVAPGVLKKTGAEGGTVTPLLYTTKTGANWKPANPFELMQPSPERINRAIRDGDEQLMLACRITGKLKTNFPTGLTLEEKAEEDGGTDAPKDADKDEEKQKKTRTLEAVKESPDDAMVLVFADVDMICDMVAYQDAFFGKMARGDNAAILFNALEFLSGTSDLIAIRSRGRFERPFDRVLKIEQKADEATAKKAEALQQKIEGFQTKIRELSSNVTKENVALLENKAAAEQRKLEEEVRVARKQLRELNAGKRTEIETLKASLRTHNLLWAPMVVLLMAIILAVIRYIKALRYTARRM